MTSEDSPITSSRKLELLFFGLYCNYPTVSFFEHFHHQLDLLVQKIHDNQETTFLIPVSGWLDSLWFNHLTEGSAESLKKSLSKLFGKFSNLVPVVYPGCFPFLFSLSPWSLKRQYLHSYNLGRQLSGKSLTWAFLPSCSLASENKLHQVWSEAIADLGFENLVVSRSDNRPEFAPSSLPGDKIFCSSAPAATPSGFCTLYHLKTPSEDINFFESARKVTELPEYSLDDQKFETLPDSKAMTPFLLSPGLAMFWEQRCKELESSFISSSSAGISTRTSHLTNSEASFERAASYLCQAQGFPPILLHPEIKARQRRLMSSAYDALLHAQVEWDSLQNPEVDPETGWIRLLEPSALNETVADTQLIRLYFSAHYPGTITALEYRPKKVNLVPLVGSGFLPSGLVSLVDDLQVFPAPPAPVAKAVPFITKKTPGLLGLRFASVCQRIVSQAANTPTSEDISTKIECGLEYTLNAGIGAHRPNSTTGFKVEYWVETDLPQALARYHVVSWNIDLPTLAFKTMRLRALHAVGGVGFELYEPSNTLELPSSSFPQGLYGLRLIDSAQSFVIDFRWTRPILHARVISNPYLEGSGDAGYLSLQFVQETKRLFTMDRAACLFVSIN